MGYKLHFYSFVFKHDKPCFIRGQQKYHVSSIVGITEITEVAKRSVLNRLWLALCNVYVCVEGSICQVCLNDL